MEPGFTSGFSSGTTRKPRFDGGKPILQRDGHERRQEFGTAAVVARTGARSGLAQQP